MPPGRRYSKFQFIVPLRPDARASVEGEGAAEAFINVYGLTAPHLTLPGCVDEGYYVLLAPLAAGEHVIHIYAHNPTTGWTLDVTDHITVE